MCHVEALRGDTCQISVWQRFCMHCDFCVWLVIKKRQAKERALLRIWHLASRGTRSSGAWCCHSSPTVQILCSVHSRLYDRSGAAKVDMYCEFVQTFSGWQVRSLVCVGGSGIQCTPIVQLERLAQATSEVGVAATDSYVYIRLHWVIGLQILFEVSVAAIDSHIQDRHVVR